MSSNAVDASNNMLLKMLTPQKGIVSSFSSPVGNRRSRETPTAVVAPRILFSTVWTGSHTPTRTSSSAVKEIGRRPFFAATPPWTSDPSLIKRFNQTWSRCAQHEEEPSPSSSSTGGAEAQRRGLLGLMEDPVTPIGVTQRNRKHGVGSRTPREHSTKNQHSLQSSFGRRILTEESLNPDLLAQSMTEEHFAPTSPSVAQHGDGVSDGSPTEEPTRKILADHAELIRTLQINIEQLKREANSSRPVSSYDLSSKLQSANTTGLVSTAGAGLFSGDVEQVVEKEVVISRLKRRLERAESDLELVQFEKSSAVTELNQSVTANQLLRKTIGELEGLVGAQKLHREHRENHETKIRELEELAEGWKREAEWRAFQKDALECLVAVRESQIEQLEKADKERRMTKSSSVCVSVAKVLAEQKADLAGVTRRLKSLLDTTKQFRRHKGTKAIDLEKLFGFETTIERDLTVSEDLKTESQQCEEEVGNLNNALKGLNEEMIELFLDIAARNITLS